MIITIDENFFIRTDSSQFILEYISIDTNENGEEKTSKKTQFYSTLEGALNGYMKSSLRKNESKIEDVKGVIQVIESTYQTIKESIKSINEWELLEKKEKQKHKQPKD